MPEKMSPMCERNSNMQPLNDVFVKTVSFLLQLLAQRKQVSKMFGFWLLKPWLCNFTLVIEESYD